MLVFVFVLVLVMKATEVGCWRDVPGKRRFEARKHQHQHEISAHVGLASMLHQRRSSLTSRIPGNVGPAGKRPRGLDAAIRGHRGWCGVGVGVGVGDEGDRGRSAAAITGTKGRKHQHQHQHQHEISADVGPASMLHQRRSSWVARIVAIRAGLQSDGPRECDRRRGEIAPLRPDVAYDLRPEALLTDAVAAANRREPPQRRRLLPGLQRWRSPFAGGQEGRGAHFSARGPPVQPPSATSTSRTSCCRVRRGASPSLAAGH